MIAALLVTHLLATQAVRVGAGAEGAALVSLPSPSVFAAAGAALQVGISFDSFAVTNITEIGFVGVPFDGVSGAGVSDMLFAGWLLHLDNGVDVVAGAGVVGEGFLIGSSDTFGGLLAIGPSAVVVGEFPIAGALSLDVTGSVSAEYPLGGQAIFVRPAVSIALVYRFGGGS